MEKIVFFKILSTTNSSICGNMSQTKFLVDFQWMGQWWVMGHKILSVVVRYTTLILGFGVEKR
jgi:hypothetical protein